jgi:hypothetical protein
MVSACAILVALFAGGGSAQSQDPGFARIQAWAKNAIGLIRPHRWTRETGVARIHAWTKVGSKTCMLDHFHDGSGSRPTRAQAERAAIRSWADFTAWEYGDAWGRYWVAVGKRMTCLPGSGGWTCTVKARPCRPY